MTVMQRVITSRDVVDAQRKISQAISNAATLKHSDINSTVSTRPLITP
jgi:hypothetical protein